MPKLAVLGHPVAHSRSPAMHTAALAALGLAPEWTYGAIDVSPEDFDELVRSLPGQGFHGVNVTVPHKLAALAIADEASPAATEIGAANVLVFEGGRIRADNTDADGILDALQRSPAGWDVLLLGAGGVARAAVWALRKAGATLHIWNRTAASADKLAAELGGEALSAEEARARTGGFDLIVNSTTVGMRPDDDLAQLPLDLEAMGEGTTVMDLVYGNHVTPLIAAAGTAGGSAIDGVEVLVRQGVAALRLWTGREPSYETMRDAALGAGT